jgi:hypothetical protein
MSVIKQKTQEALSQAKTQARREAGVPTYRTILIASSVGVLIGFLLRR